MVSERSSRERPYSLSLEAVESNGIEWNQYNGITMESQCNHNVIEQWNNNAIAMDSPWNHNGLTPTTCASYRATASLGSFHAGASGAVTYARSGSRMSSRSASRPQPPRFVVARCIVRSAVSRRCLPRDEFLPNHAGNCGYLMR